MQTSVVIGMELTRLIGPDGTPWRLTVDVYEDDGSSEPAIKRYEVTGSFNGWRNGAPTRTVQDIARGCSIPPAVAREFERLDYEYAEKVAALAAKLQRDQWRVLRDRALRNQEGGRA